MENFTLGINRLKKSTDGKLFIVFDILVGGVKVGEAESDYSLFNGMLMEKFHEFLANAQSENIKALITGIGS